MTQSPAPDKEITKWATQCSETSSVVDKDVDYLADDGIASVVFLAEKLGKPVLVEGPAGTGKTELAKSLKRP